MEDLQQRCPKCGGEMRQGVQVYRDEANYYPLYWVEGEPVKRVFLGFTGMNLDIDGRQILETATFKCSDCGFLESYAA